MTYSRTENALFLSEHVMQNRESTSRVLVCESCAHPVFNQSPGGFICIIAKIHACAKRARVVGAP